VEHAFCKTRPFEKLNCSIDLVQMLYLTPNDKIPLEGQSKHAEGSYNCGFDDVAAPSNGCNVR